MERRTGALPEPWSSIGGMERRIVSGTRPSSHRRSSPTIRVSVGPRGELAPPGAYVSPSNRLCDQRIAGAYWIPPSETRAFRVPAREIRQSFMASDPLTPS